MPIIALKLNINCFNVGISAKSVNLNFVYTIDNLCVRLFSTFNKMLSKFESTNFLNVF